MEKSLNIPNILHVGYKSFQADSNIVWNVYQNNLNYKIEYDEKYDNRNYCAVYFCSNDIYFPNDEAIFRKRIIEKDFYEWYGSRVEKAYKHIFLRDIFKQWYLAGININIDSPEKLLDFLKKETEGMKVITIGSSAGGYAAILYGIQLGAERILAFNAQFELESTLLQINERIYPLVYRLQATERRKYYDLKQVIDLNSSNIYYFHSALSPWDIKERKHIADCSNIHILSFKTKHHGIPFLKVALKKVLNLDNEQLNKYAVGVNHPICFTVRIVGVVRTVKGFINQAYKAYKKRYRFRIT